MKFASLRRTAVYVSLLGLLCTGTDSRSQQSPSADNGSALAADGAKIDTQREFSQALGDNEAVPQSHPQDAQLSLRIGLLRGQAGDFAGAAKAFKHALEIQPNFAEAHYNLGLALLADSGNMPAWREALAQFQAALAARPKYFQAQRLAGVALLESGDANKAIPELKAALSLEPTSAEVHFDLGRAFEATGNSSEAYAEYAAALKERVPYPEADNALGLLLLARQENEAAAEHFNAALAARPDFEGAHYGLAKALKAQGKTQESKLELKQAAMLLQRQSDAVMSAHLSNESLDRAKRGDIQAGVQLAKKAIWLDPTNAVANFNMGLLLADTRNLEASTYQLRKAISLAPFRTNFYLDLSRVQEKANDRTGAIETIHKAIQIDPGDPAPAAALKRLEAGDSSIPRRQSTTDAGPFAFGAPSDTADSHFAFATQISEKGDFIGAIGEMLRALILEPTRSDIRYNLAVAETQIGQYDRAELELRIVLRLSPDSVQAHLALGSLLFQANDLTNAASEFHQVLRLQPDNQQALKLLRQCQTDSAR
jgi:tetratricopeptide (TPR) repeat protein